MTWVLIALLAISAPVETLIAPMPPGFIVGAHDDRGGVSTERRVPRGETADHWTRMITVQRFVGLAHVDPHEFADRLGTKMATACPDSNVITSDGNFDGVAIGEIRFFCQRNPATGRSSTMLGRVFQGDTDLFMVRYAFGAPPGDKESAANAYIASVHLSRPARR